MRIIYAYKKNIYAALRAAYLHLKFNTDLIPQSPLDLEKLHHQTKPHYIGIDEDLNEVYVATYGRNKDIFFNSMKGLANIYGEEIEIIILTEKEEKIAKLQ